MKTSELKLKLAAFSNEARRKILILYCDFERRSKIYIQQIAKCAKIATDF